jgi:hypothetical protein
MKEGRCLSLIMLILFLAALITGVFVIKSESTEAVPPCDEYLVWCIYTWCPQNNPSWPPEQCRAACIEKYMEWCN